MILVIGEALIDLIGKNDASGNFTAVVGGANANVALALARRGEPQQFLGRISTDGFGVQIRHRLSSNGVNLELAIAATEQATLAVASIDPAGVASYSFYINGTADWAWEPRELPSLEKLQELGVSAVQFGCLAMAIEPGNLVIEDWLLALYAAGAVTLSHDLNIRSALGFERSKELQRVQRTNSQSHIIKASDADLEWLFDLPAGADLDEICHLWSQGSKLVVLTRGASGASLYRGGKRIDVAAPKIQLVDTVGAGDTFMANFLAEINALAGLGAAPKPRLLKLSDQDLEQAAAIAAVAAGIVCERAGCEPPTKEEVGLRISE
ncbi:PfkB family carbohydrate kinase [Candidatus Aquiluna sp. UB-MaderosW2red]|uniref:PfkB family carbohydrate kinase n=1 Tax=Candidatus Aquiluna sp. UB-MaderosW2red TaxID=1855377 RepID=UPI000875E8CD|nr:PfkB family carbohydrate kinase [Candidatus Aquiluna sp. UB-MaderosW2red]SCX15517.1 fructokinase [Candidatus Aquiluna sp. UB-MaderosW2red]